MKRPFYFIVALTVLMMVVFTSCIYDNFDHINPIGKRQLDFPAEGGKETVSIKGYLTWEVKSSDPEWCTLNRSSGKRNAEVLVTVEKNTTTSERYATITFDAEGRLLYVAVTQAAGQHKPNND